MKHKNGDKWMCNISHCGAVIPFMLTKKDDIWLGDDGETYCPIEFLYQVEAQKPEPIKPEEGGKCPLGCEDSKLEYTSYECVCNVDNAPCWHCENATLECNQCGNEFVED